jgi:hypothetical protein
MMRQTATYKSKEVAFTIDGIDVHKYSDVIYNVESATKSAWLSGKSFIIDATDEAYYHFVFENVGQFNALKSVISDLNLVILMPDEQGYEVPDYITWCVERLCSENSNALVIRELSRNLRFDSLYVASPRLIRFFHYLESGLFDLVRQESYQRFVVPSLREFFLRNLPLGESNGKIYASQKTKGDEIRFWKEYLDYLKDNGVSWDKETKTVSDPLKVLENLPDRYSTGGRHTYTPPWVLELEVLGRYLPEADEQALEDCFSSQGFEIMSHLEVSYANQMAKIANCESYVTVTGASVLNAVVCPIDAKIVIIKNGSNWLMPNHDYLPNLISKNSTVVDVKDLLEKVDKDD